eukprot:3795695-Rhodomonas_salina.2
MFSAINGRSAEISGGNVRSADGSAREKQLRYDLHGSRLRACYAMSGTELAYGGISLRTTRWAVLRRRSLRACYSMSGTEMPYGPTSPVHSTARYALSTRKVAAYARAMRCPVLA